MKKTTLLTLVISIVIQVFTISVYANQTEINTSENIDSKGKIYCTATINDEFADDKILVVFNSQESLKFVSHTNEDFEGLNIKSIDDLSSAARVLVQEKIEQILVQSSDEKVYSRNLAYQKETEPINIDINKYNQIVQITLNKHSKANVLAVIKELEKRDDVLIASPDYTMYLSDTYETSQLTSSTTNSSHVTQQYIRTLTNPPTNDPYANIQWGLEITEFFEAWAHAVEATVLVGVMDSGIDGTHPDLVNNINFALSRDFTYTVPNNTTATVDTNGHGTAVSGILAAQINNSIGVSGASPNAELVSLKVMHGSNEETSLSAVIRALDYASSANIKIVNASIAAYNKTTGTPSNNFILFEQNLELLEHTIENYNGLLICGASNMSCDIDGPNDAYPAELNCENILTVGASDRADEKFMYSCWGAESVDLFAPGVLCLSCIPNDKCTICQPDNPNDSDEERIHYAKGYHFFRDTSCATPFVTAVASMLLAKYPYMTACDLKQTILNNVDDASDGVTAFTGKCVSGGRLNAFKAITNPLCSHNYLYYNETSQNHTAICSKCNHTVSEVHTLGEYESYTSMTHIRKCTHCSYQTQAFHRWTAHPSTGETICGLCGYLKTGTDDEED